MVNHEISSHKEKCEEKRNAERKCWKYSELTKDSFEGQRPDKRIKIADEVLSPKDSTLTTLRTSRLSSIYVLGLSVYRGAIPFSYPTEE